MINFMHQTGECRWNQPLVTCTFPSPSQQLRSSLRQISLKNTHTHHRLPTHQHRQDSQINPTTPDPKRHGIRAHQIRRSRLCMYIYTRRRKENQKRFFYSHRSKKEYQYKYSSGLSVSEEIYRSDEYPKEKNLFLFH